jgi:hypothetical protein
VTAVVERIFKLVLPLLAAVVGALMVTNRS